MATESGGPHSTVYQPPLRNFSVRCAGIRFVPPASPDYRCAVSPYEGLDAFKACHQLTLAVHRVVETLEERDATLAAQLWAAALCASSRIARGSGFRNRRMFAACVDRTLAALAEISFYLEVGCAMDLISKDERQELESLGGRASFYSIKLVTSLPSGRPSETGPAPQKLVQPRP